jgi:hypothetical protein
LPKSDLIELKDPKSRRRQPLVKKIITEIAENFIKNICEKLSMGKTLSQIESEMLKEAKACATRLTEAYISQIDANILGDKAGRREAGYSVERRGDERRLQTQLGEISYHRTYYKKAAGGYEYLTDTFLGVESRQRISEEMSLSLSNAAKDMSYGKASTYLCDGEISRQTVMNHIRQSEAVAEVPTEKRRVPELHIDADEAHITLCGGRKSEVPLISVYEGIEKQGKRNKCKNVFHISEYGKKPDELWEQALTEIEQRYDLTGTKIYMHGDGGNWIQTGLEWIPGAVFVLDKYHKNKAIKSMTAGLEESDQKLFDREIRWSLENEDFRFFEELTFSLCRDLPERAEKILESAEYLRRFVSGISICKKDPCANNGGCTEPHVSHILSARLSSRPMAWSSKTLKKLAPVLAAGNVALKCKEDNESLPLPLRKAAARASKALRRGVAGLPSPDAIGALPISGKITGTQKILKLFC